MYFKYRFLELAQFLKSVGFIEDYGFFIFVGNVFRIILTILMVIFVIFVNLSFFAVETIRGFRELGQLGLQTL